MVLCGSPFATLAVVLRHQAHTTDREVRREGVGAHDRIGEMRKGRQKGGPGTPEYCRLSGHPADGKTQQRYNRAGQKSDETQTVTRCGPACLWQRNNRCRLLDASNHAVGLLRLDRLLAFGLIGIDRTPVRLPWMGSVGRDGCRAPCCQCSRQDHHCTDPAHFHNEFSLRQYDVPGIPTTIDECVA